VRLDDRRHAEASVSTCYRETGTFLAVSDEGRSCGRKMVFDLEKQKHLRDSELEKLSSQQGNRSTSRWWITW
jgi:hypothetical protein